MSIDIFGYPNDLERMDSAALLRTRSSSSFCFMSDLRSCSSNEFSHHEGQAADDISANSSSFSAVSFALSSSEDEAPSWLDASECSAVSAAPSADSTETTSSRRAMLARYATALAFQGSSRSIVRSSTMPMLEDDGQFDDPADVGMLQQRQQQTVRVRPEDSLQLRMAVQWAQDALPPLFSPSSSRELVQATSNGIESTAVPVPRVEALDTSRGEPTTSDNPPRHEGPT